MDFGLAGRAALVLAASKGLGRATAEALANEGADVAIGARDAGELDATAAAIRERTGCRVVAIPVDVTDAVQSQRFVETALGELGRIDILVNNAGGPPFGRFDDFDDDAWFAAFELSLRSTVRMTRLVLPHLPHDGHGRIINVVSMSVRSLLPGSMLSTAMRAGVVGMAKLLAEEVGAHGITVNNVAPGLILTDRLKHFGAKPEQAEAIPLRRFGRPDEFASVVAFLASERASYVTGMTIPVDGGAIRAIS
ncbi:short-chain dehydrogenase [Vulcanimicrobium alpinum]|uniref:Short-chain dehydrogenase n=1 Tax=Vulcanimicrobium alpinum TaxID=3016050 RepID=A0AAN1Y0E9_UNVUL|nr:SDR family oxidoreductase [Vulcanimicrobium alpinum]BDE07717.1 short-chain dehydrogenase [Vulcanimicrobium alpinum]